ncbi:hypothetical protein DL89DRAFT_18525 [Linderina pennispora]|uniref:HMG box domain-containing protein n=1 Tax=Linderina pennispora TaxID=61395 RepID=A0A1Y1WLS6_9FUNG|nr:uncharacterized protein DL89DRAFT_18525 [Linderina pennispora]ORX74531.1 hypothetical protein DL89DRAFT_18525 [Linderina pennispora]
MTTPNTSNFDACSYTNICQLPKPVGFIPAIHTHTPLYEFSHIPLSASADPSRLTFQPLPTTNLPSYFSNIPNTPILTRSPSTPELVRAAASPILPLQRALILPTDLSQLAPSELVIPRPLKCQTRALNAYMLFRKSVIGKFKHSGLSASKITELITDAWKKMTEDEKLSFREMSKQQQRELDKANGRVVKKARGKKDRKKRAHRFVDCIAKKSCKEIPKLETYPLVPSNAPVVVPNATTVYAQYVQGCQDLVLSVDMTGATTDLNPTAENIMIPPDNQVFELPPGMQYMS